MSEIKNEEQIKTILTRMANKLGHPVNELDIFSYVSTNFLKKWALRVSREMCFKNVDSSKCMYNAYFTRKNYYEYDKTETVTFIISHKHVDNYGYLRAESIQVDLTLNNGELL